MCVFVCVLFHTTVVGEFYSTRYGNGSFLLIDVGMVFTVCIVFSSVLLGSGNKAWWPSEVIKS